MRGQPSIPGLSPLGARARFALRSPLAWSLALHAASRVLFHLAGVRFDDTPLYGFLQFVDVPRLRDDLADSLLHLHMQPPLFNAFAGLVLKLAPEGAEQPLFWSCFLAVGALLHVSLYALMRSLGAGRGSAAAGALLFSVGPAAIVYESWLFYSYPLAALLCAAAALLPRYVARPSRVTGLLFFASIAAVALTYALFHLLWCAAVLGLVLLAVPRGDRRRTLLAALPLLLVVALYLKNLALFGQFTASSWFGMNLASITLHNTPPAELTTLIEEEVLSPVARIRAFSPLASYPPQRIPTPEDAAPILVIPTNSSETPNLNHFAYLEISHRYLLDGIALIRARPGIYLRNVGHALLVLAQPTTQYPFLGGNVQAIRSWERAWRIFPGGVAAALREEAGWVNYADPGSLALRAAWLWMALLVAVLVHATAAGLRAFCDPRPRPREAMLLFIALSIGTVALLSSLIELGENNRFRAMIDPLVWAVAWSSADGVVRRFRGGAGRGSTSRVG